MMPPPWTRVQAILDGTWELLHEGFVSGITTPDLPRLSLLEVLDADLPNRPGLRSGPTVSRCRVDRRKHIALRQLWKLRDGDLEAEERIRENARALGVELFEQTVDHVVRELTVRSVPSPSDELNERVRSRTERGGSAVWIGTVQPPNWEAPKVCPVRTALPGAAVLVLPVDERLAARTSTTPPTLGWYPTRFGHHIALEAWFQTDLVISAAARERVLWWPNGANDASN